MPVRFNIYEFVRIKRKDPNMGLPGSALEGDTGIIDSVTYSPLDWYRVSLDKDGFSFAIKGEDLEKR